MGKHENTLKNHQNSSQKAPQDSLGDPWRTPSAPGFLPEWILSRFWLPFGFPVGTLLAPMSGSFFVYFSGTLLERLWDILAWIWESFGINFGSIFDAFWETLCKVKIELALRRQPHFQTFRVSRIRYFCDFLPTSRWEHPKVYLFLKILRFGLHFWVPVGPHFHFFSTPFSRAFFDTF